MKALVIGRYQPMHLGHHELIKDIDSFGLEKIIIGVGIEGKGRNHRNPFTYDEVKELWLPNFKHYQTPIEIIGIPDIGNNAEYARHVSNVAKISEEDTIIVSGNKYTIDCFVNYGNNYRVYSGAARIPIGNDFLCATMIRQWIAEDGPWENYMTKETIEAMKQIDGVNILKSIYNLRDTPINDKLKTGLTIYGQ